MLNWRRVQCTVLRLLPLAGLILGGDRYSRVHQLGFVLLGGRLLYTRPSLACGHVRVGPVMRTQNQLAFNGV